MPEPQARRARTPTRRAILVAGGTVVGLGLGFALWPRRWPEPQALDPRERPMNAWIRIAPEGRVAVAVPQAEMGQGVLSGFAQIVADELGAAWDHMAVEPAPLHPAYAHRWFARHLAADLPPGIRDLAGFAGATVFERIAFQLTGGSTSIRGYEAVLREAAAAVRQTLIHAAARRWEVDPDDVHAADGQLIYKARTMGFGQAAGLVSMADIPEQVSLRPVQTRPLAGKSLPRLDIPAKVNGTARFGADVRVPDMLFAAIRHGPAGDSRLDHAAAPNGVTLVRGPNWVASVGRTTWEARRALARVKARFRIAGRPAGPWIADAVTNAARTGDGGTVAQAGGDLPPPGPASHVADYRVPFLAHACMEPMVATARLTDGRAEIWAPTQSLTLATHAVARALDIDADAVTVYPTLLGGGFGRKLETDAIVEAALIARATGRPVQLQWTREEDFGASVVRPLAAARMRGDLGSGGRITAWEARIAVPSVGLALLGRVLPLPDLSKRPTAEAIDGADRLAYAADAFRAVHVPVQYPVAIGYWRSAGHGFSTFFTESFIDELAAAAGSDPLLFRRRLLAGNRRHRALLDAVAAESGWGTPVARGFGRGVAIHESFGSVVAMVVEAGIADGAVVLRRVTSAIDCGRALNPDSVRGQVEGAALMGLAAAVHGRIDFAEGHAVQRNFDTYRIPALGQSPDMTTLILDSGAPIGGVSEPGLPPAAPALANALAAATGRRCRTLPLAACYRS